MKLSLDPKFLTTALVTFAVLTIAVVVVNALAGPAPATVAAAAVSTISIKLFDKFDYEPTLVLEPGAPFISAPWIYSVVIGVMVVWGCQVFAEAAIVLVERIKGPDYCSVLFVTVVSCLDIGGFAAAGWVLGKLFRDRALAVTSAGGFAYFVVALLQVTESADIARILACLGFDSHDAAVTGFSVGAVFGAASRAYLAILLARIASSRDENERDEATEPSA